MSHSSHDLNAPAREDSRRRDDFSKNHLQITQQRRLRLTSRFQLLLHDGCVLPKRIHFDIGAKSTDIPAVSDDSFPFGPTPISQGNECRLVTKVNLLGKLEGDPKVLKSIRDGDAIRVEIAK